MKKAIILDFGGVFAEEGFREGFRYIGEKNRIDNLYEIAYKHILDVGYIVGKCDELYFWKTLKRITGLNESDSVLREEILKRFIVRDEMISHARKLKSLGVQTAIHSDNTNWLDEINIRNPFFHYFDYIFNSYTLKKIKRDFTVFEDVAKTIGVLPQDMLFIDDNSKNLLSAQKVGIKTLLFEDIEKFDNELYQYLD